MFENGSYLRRRKRFKKNDIRPATLSSFEQPLVQQQAVIAPAPTPTPQFDYSVSFIIIFPVSKYITKLEFASFVHQNWASVAGFGLWRLPRLRFANLLQWSTTRESLSAPIAAVSGMDVLPAAVWFRCQPICPFIRHTITAHVTEPKLQVIFVLFK